MSVSLWEYTPEKCDGNPCCGDCDLCSKANEEIGTCETCAFWNKWEDSKYGDGTCLLCANEYRMNRNSCREWAKKGTAN